MNFLIIVVRFKISKKLSKREYSPVIFSVSYTNLLVEKIGNEQINFALKIVCAIMTYQLLGCV